MTIIFDPRLKAVNDPSMNGLREVRSMVVPSVGRIQGQVQGDAAKTRELPLPRRKSRETG